MLNEKETITLEVTKIFKGRLIYSLSTGSGDEFVNIGAMYFLVFAAFIVGMLFSFAFF